MLQAYFKTSVKRFVDSCVSDIDRAVLQKYIYWALAFKT